MNEVSQDLKAKAKALNVDVETKYKNPDKVIRVKFKFAKKVWADLANGEGELLGACCAAISSIRDCFIDAMRDDGWMGVDEMLKLVTNMNSHEFDDKHPCTQVKNTFESLLPHIELRDGHSTLNLNDLDDVCDTVYFGKVFDFCAHNTNKLFSDYGKDTFQQSEVNLMLFEVIPCVKKLAEKIQDAGFPPVEGYGLFSAINGKIMNQLRGLPIYADEEGAKKTLGYWVRGGSVKAEDVEICKCRCSWEKGLEKLETIENPWTKPRPNPEISWEESEKIFDTLRDLMGESENTKVSMILRSAMDRISALKNGCSEQDYKALKKEASGEKTDEDEGNWD